MRFTRHKFSIGLLLVLMPLVAGLAFVRTPIVSSLVLKFTLKLTRFQTGLTVNAESWDINPLSFSGSLQNLSLEHNGLKLTAPAVSIQLSPLYLFVGSIHLNRILFKNLHMSGEIPKQWLNNTESHKKPEDIVSDLGTDLMSLLDQLEKHNLSFEQIETVNMSSQLREGSFSDATISLWNLNEGQLRLQADVSQLQSSLAFSKVEHFKTYLSLLKTGKKNYILSLREMELSIDSENKIQVAGVIPGKISLKTDIELHALNSWLKQSKLLASHAIAEELSGHLQGNIDVSFKSNALLGLNGTAKSSNLIYDGYRLKEFSAKFEHDDKQTLIEDLRLVTPNKIPQERSYDHLVSSPRITIKDNLLKGSIQFKNIGLCSVLYATTVEDCFTSFLINGSAELEGPLDPMMLRARVNLKHTKGLIVSDNLFIDPKSSPIAEPKDGVISGELEIRAKDLIFLQVKSQFGKSTEFTTNGTIAYVPTLVDLVSDGQNVHMEELTNNFLDLPIEGHGRVQVKSFFSKKIPQTQGRTRITSQINLEQAGVDGQLFGDMSGTLTYARKILEIGPFKVRSGGGRAGIVGQLKPVRNNQASHLSLSAALDKLELKTFLNEKTTPFLSGFVSGNVNFAGLTSASSEGLSGPLNLDIEGIKIFNIPLERGVVAANYRNRTLFIDRAEAYKNRQRVSIEGKLDPQGGSFIRFRTRNVPISTLGYMPDLEKIFTQGLISLDGVWKPQKGVELKAGLKEMKVADRLLGSGSFSLVQNDQIFEIKAEAPQLIDVTYSELYNKALGAQTHIQAEFQNNGLYAALSYMNSWTSNRPSLQVTGGLKLDWAPDSGSLSSSGMKIRNANSVTGGIQNLISLEKGSELSWKGKKIITNTFAMENLSVSEGVGSKLNFEGEIKAELVDLFLPEVLQLNAGLIKAQGSVSLPPDIRSLRVESQVKNGNLLLESLGKPITQIHGNFEISKEKIRFQKLEGLMGNGRTTLQGDYTIGHNLGALALDIQLDDAEAVLLSDVPVTASGYLNMRGEKMPYLLSGRVHLSKALYAKEYENNASYALANNLNDESLLYSIEAELNGDTAIRNSLISSQVNGQMLLQGSDLKPRITGSLEFKKGVIYAKDNEFKISQGRMVFSPEGESTPVVNLRAETTIKLNTSDYRVELSANGPTNNMNLSFNSDPSLNTSEILSLLAFGVLPDNKEWNNSQSATGTNTENSNLVQAAQYEAFQAVFGKAIGKNLNKQTGLDVRVTSAPDLRDRGSIPKVTVGTRIAKGVTATYGRSLDNTRPTEDVRIDYKLLDNVNLSGVWQNTDENKTSTGLDLRFRFDIK